MNNYVKKTMTCAFVLVVFFALHSNSYATISLDGKMVDNRLLVPLRSIFENLGATVEWDSSTKSIIGTKGNTIVKLVVSQKQALVNGESVVLDVPAKVINEKTYVPLRFIAESLGANVTYDSEERIAEIKLGEILITVKNNSTGLSNEVTSNIVGIPMSLDAIYPLIIWKESYDGTPYLDFDMNYSRIEYNSINTPILKLVAHNNMKKTITAFEFTCNFYDEFDRPVNKIGTSDNLFYGIVQQTSLSGSDIKIEDKEIYYDYIYNYIERNLDNVVSGVTSVEELESKAIRSLTTFNSFAQTNEYEFNLTLYDLASQVRDFKLLRVKYDDGTIWTNK